MDNSREEQVTRALDALGSDLRRQPSVKNDVMRRVNEQMVTSRAPTAWWRGQRVWPKLVAVAACVVIGLMIWNPSGRGIGASEAFAQAIANVQNASTFSCRQIVTELGPDGKEQVREMSFIFQEPDLERIEYGPGYAAMGEYMVTDYASRQRLIVYGEDKSAVLQDLSSAYSVEPKTGELELSQLGTHPRDDVLRISAQAVKDLGMTKLGDQPVWVLQSEGDAEPVKTVYVNPDSGKPVRVEITWPTRKHSFTYADIRIDADMNESIFSLAPPAGYALRTEKPIDEHYGKMAAKVMRILQQCYVYRNKHDMEWPATLADLTETGMDKNALKTLLAPPDEPDGKPAFVYKRPAKDQLEGIVLYEAAHSRRGGKVVAGYTDGHAQVLTIEEFEAQMKGQ
jgi:outer membrane lipoprotein-sorting protein